jgi:hypothetical protein
MLRAYVAVLCAVYIVVIFSFDYPRILALRGLHLHDEL